MQLLRMGPGGGPPAAPASSRSWQSGTCLSGRFAARPAGGRAAGQATTTVSPERDLWWDFAESAAGEWEGVTATFTPDGKPKPLPDYYVPEVGGRLVAGGRCAAMQGGMANLLPVGGEIILLLPPLTAGIQGLGSDPV